MNSSRIPGIIPAAARVLLWLAVLLTAVSAQESSSWGMNESEQPEEMTSEAPRDAIIEFFDVNNADIRSVFTQLSAFSGIDIVLADNVKGNVTLSVTKKTWREILLIVCKVERLTPIKEDEYIYVVPTADYLKEQVETATVEAAAAEVSPLKREVVKCKNVEAAELQKPLEGLLSPRGKIAVASHSNALIIFDSQRNIEAIVEMARVLDIETEQVSISCKIIEVSSGALQELGIQWGYFDDVAGAPARVSHLEGDNVIGSALERLSWGILTPNKLSFALEYLCQESNGEVVAQPQITTLDNKEASIFTGSQIPITTVTSDQVDVRMIDARTQLIARPHITGDGRIMLTLNPSKRSFEFRNEQPVIHEQGATTTVVVNHGETVVIAGLTANEVKNSEGGIPVLKDIPFIGALFKRTRRSVDKKDLVIFVTPYIIHKQIEAVSGEASDLNTVQ